MDANFQDAFELNSIKECKHKHICIAALQFAVILIW